MKSKSILILMSILCVVMSGKILAAVTWDNGGVGNLWSTNANWDTDVAPITTDDPVNITMNGANAALIDSTIAAVGTRLNVGFGSGVGQLDMTGGSLTMPADLTIGFFDKGVGTAAVNVTGGTIGIRELYLGFYETGSMNYSNATGTGRYGYVGIKAGSTGILNMGGGSFAFSREFRIGWDAGATGTVNMTGGELITARGLQLGANNGVGHIQLDGGVISSGSLFISTISSIDITGSGVLTVAGDVSTDPTILGYISSNLLTANGGTGVVNINYDSNINKTLFTAIPEPCTLAFLGMGVLVAGLSRRK